VSAELLAKLTAHGVQFTGGGFGGAVEISESDVAAALAGLDHRIYEFMRLKFCGDASMMKRVVEGVAWDIVLETFSDERDPGIKLARNLALIVVHQATEGPLCPNCNGTGTFRYRDCKACDSGRRHMSIRLCASMAGVSRAVYRRDWERLVNFYVSKLQGYEAVGVAHIWRQLKKVELGGGHPMTVSV